jgi:hypothetical protein
MMLPLAMAVGEQRQLLDPVVLWTAKVSDAIPPSVVLTASVRAGPSPPIFQNQGGMATTLAVQMDAGVAMTLHRQLGELGRSMGWLPQVSDEFRE